MPISEGYKAIDEVWASDPTATRTDPESTTLNPPLDVEDGWPDSFSADAGNTPRRGVFNEMYYRFDSALVNVRDCGILPWDTAVDTLAGGIKQVSGVLYRALVDNGPTYTNAISPTAAGQTVWATVSGVTSAPSAPSAPDANSPESGELDWFWNCPLDGGAQVTEFDFQWRVSGTMTWSASIVVNTARHVLTGLTNGTAIEARVRARSSHATGPWSATGSSTPSGTVPGGGSTLALRATAGDGEVDLDWLEPDDGGVSITSYTVQWRTSGQSFSTGRQATSTDTEHTVGSRTNGTEYFFRVRAVNGEGNSAWSNEASATPEATVVPPTPDPDEEPDQVPSAPTGEVLGTSILWSWTLPEDNGQRITQFDLQWRVQGSGWSGNIVQVTASCYHLTGLTAGTTYQVRVRARNSVGTQNTWSSTGSADVHSIGGYFERTTVGTQSFVWPWAATSARVSLVSGGNLPPGIRIAAQNINLGTAGFTGGVSDGVTLWFVNSTAGMGMAVAYTASTRARNSAFDINLGSGNWSLGVSDGVTLWFVDNTANQFMAVAYTASTRARNSAFDINLGGIGFNGGVSDGVTLWFVNATTRMAVAYTASTRARNSAFDISLGGTGNWTAGVSDGVTLWFVNFSTRTAVAYTASTRARNSAFDINLGSGNWLAATSDGVTLWFVDTTSLIWMAVAYSGGNNIPTSTSVTGSGIALARTTGGVEIRHETITGAQNSSITVTVGRGATGAGAVQIVPIY